MYRVKAWLATVFAAMVTTESFATQSLAEKRFAELLDMGRDDGGPLFTGGHIEHHVDGIGWVVAHDTANYPDPD